MCLLISEIIGDNTILETAENTFLFQICTTIDEIKLVFFLTFHTLLISVGFFCSPCKPHSSLRVKQ